MSYNAVVWLPNALILTGLLGAFAWWRWRRRGVLTGLRWTGVALLPLALYGMGLYRLAWSVGLAFSRFASGFAFRPSVWFGLILSVLAVVLIVLPSKVSKRTDRSVSAGPAPRAIGAKKPDKKKAGRADDDMSEIEDILKRHGIG